MIRYAVIFITFILLGEKSYSYNEVHRTILALYNSDYAKINNHPIHKYLEMPLNHLGLSVEYWDIKNGFPNIDDYKSLRGVISWFFEDKMKDPAKYLAWASQVIDKGHKFLIFGVIGAEYNLQKKQTSAHLINTFLNKLGLRYYNKWQPISHDIKYIMTDPEIVQFERILDKPFKSYRIVQVENTNVVSLLNVNVGGGKFNNTDLISIGPNGGWIRENTMLYYYKNGSLAKWYINPFEIIFKIFEIEKMPIPDTTTLSGRRIYYSHIDGDGLRNITEINPYKIHSGPENHVYACDVVLEHLIRPHSDLPVTVSAIAGDLDLKWFGTSALQKVIKNIFALPQVEVGSHTYSHPFNWDYYKDPDSSKKEMREYGYFPDKKLLDEYLKSDKHQKKIAGYTLPRAYMLGKFEIDKEVRGSIKFLTSLCPKNKKVEIIQWSGNCKPYARAIKEAYKNNVQNMNCGDTRFDYDYPSYTTVWPIGIDVDGQRQVYSSNSNENTYTNEWRGPFGGFSNLIQTLYNTEIPRRVKPINVYYHMFSGQKVASVNAVLNNLEYANSQPIAPITASYFARIANGFYTTRFVKIAEDKWEIHDRGALNTIRFEKATNLIVDFENSSGVIGQKHCRGVLYITLDAAVKIPVLAIQQNKTESATTRVKKPYLIESRYRVEDFKLQDKYFSYKAQGFGDGEMVWFVPLYGKYKITETCNGQELSQIVNVVEGSQLNFILQTRTYDKICIMVRFMGDGLL
jgi:polysaccharide biosynthesis protein PelA